MPASQAPKLPPAPVLVEPCGATPVDAEAIHFEWEPVEGAQRYRLEIAEDASFESVIFSEEFEDLTALTLAGVLPANEQTYFWHVLAGIGEDWSTADRIESFTSVDHDAAINTRNETPIEDRYGPVGGLFAATTVEAAHEATGGKKLLDREAAYDVEHDRIEAGQLLSLALSVLVALFIVIFFVFQWTTMRTMNARQSVANQASYPDLSQLRAQEQQQLNNYQLLDSATRTYALPIDHAMDLVVSDASSTNPGMLTRELPISPALEDTVKSNP